MYADILLPLAVTGSYTYFVPPTLAQRVAVGSRVVVPLGQRKHYTGIVVRLHEKEPAEGVRLKEIADVTNNGPIVLPDQLALWKWIAQYYICTAGEVMKAALPAGMRPGSETLIVRDEDFCNWEELTSRERAILTYMPDDKAVCVSDIGRTAGVSGILAYVRRLLEKGAVRIDPRATQMVERDITCHERFPRKCGCIDGSCGWHINPEYNACLYSNE